MATENLIPEPDEAPSLRDTLDAAFQEQATDEIDQPAAGAAAPPQAEGRQRDQHGRFAPKQEPAEGQHPPAEGQKPAQEAAQQPGQAQGGLTPPPQPGDLKAPASWRPTAREKWGALDPEVRQEIHRREYELHRAVQQGAETRQFQQAFENVVRPYEMFIRAENSNPLQAVQNLMQTAAELRMGTPQAKAQIAAAIITSYGIDLETLDKLLAGQAPAGGQAAQQQQQFRDPRLDQLLYQQQQILENRQAQQENTIRQELETFGQAHEFYRDVAGVMADLVEIRARQGHQVGPGDLEKIYNQACQMDEQVATILNQRRASAQRGNTSQAVLRAKRAASSIKGDSQPGDGSIVPKDDSVRAAIEAAIGESGRA
jgi:hypothetical protein